MNANQPAYPAAYNLMNSGLTKRELIAAMALQGILANEIPYENIVAASVNYADALLKELQETES